MMTDAPGNERITDTGGFDVLRVVYISMGLFIGLFALLLVLAVLGAVLSVERFGSIVSIIRDIMLILLALEGALIVLALVILIAQVARLVNLLQNEIQPVLQNTQETVQTARGTVEFVGKNVTEPVIKANSFVAGTGVFLREVFRIRELTRRETETTPDSNS
jgi:hypothetical protein